MSSPDAVTPRSQELRRLAARLAQSCPKQQGQEIILFGSAGWGTADSRSDIDLDLWVEAIPPLAEAQRWLLDAGCTLLPADEGGEGMHLIGQYQGEWVELTWHTSASITRELTAILAGEVTARGRLAQAWNLVHGLVLRTGGLATGWQLRLSAYPDALQARLVQAGTEFWAYPHHIEMLWTLAERGAVMGLEEWLFADLEDGLRVLFAANRTWEPDWKSLAAAATLLQHKPGALDARVNALFLEPRLEERVALLLHLLAEILALVPPALDVSIARRNIDASLRQHRPQR